MPLSSKWTQLLLFCAEFKICVLVKNAQNRLQASVVFYCEILGICICPK
uniref:Uncharacterized protein n=1 Tax=Setaria viridis TaxID=4556 RepID=A0A4V6D4Q0_SETVI|nr:hypothetical protein SEVIR_7G276101v2 [Setaria viridis]TKW07326.1 hypothetical protein SEVIR_7G297812v2 [Setaria viridis]